MNKITQCLLVLLTLVITVFSYLSYMQLKDINRNTVMNEAWLSTIDKDIWKLRNEIWGIEVWGGGYSFPSDVSNNIEDILYYVWEIDEKFESFTKRYTDRTALYLNANKNSLMGYLNSIAN